MDNWVMDIILVVIIIAIANSLVLTWILGDAKYYDEEPLAWGLYASFLGIFILPFYFWIRKRDKCRCISCGRWLRTGLSNCPWCGK